MPGSREYAARVRARLLRVSSASEGAAHSERQSTSASVMGAVYSDCGLAAWTGSRGPWRSA